ncbi:FAD binding domain-containing protein [Thermodesulfobacteriota bacterium]
MMRLPKFEYVVPATIDEALSLLNQYGQEACLLAGGTDLLVAAKLRNVTPRLLISMGGIQDLKGVTYEEGKGMKIGALTPLYHIRNDPMVLKYYSGLAQAAASVGAPQLQRMGTIGGNVCLNTRCFFYNQSSSWRRHRQVCFKMGGDICHVVPKGKKCFALFSADTSPVLMALEAKLKLISSKGERVLPIKEFYTGDGKKPTTINPGEILSEIQLPPPPAGQSSIYLKYRIRSSIDFPLAGVAVSIVKDEKSEDCRRAEVVLTALGSAPIIVNVANNLLKGASISKEVIREASDMAVRAAHPVANADSTPTYRRKMAGILTGNALEELSKAFRI